MSTSLTEKEYTCPKCDEDTIFYEKDGTDNGLWGIYYQYWIECGITRRECNCVFTQEELEELEKEISEIEIEWMLEGECD